MWHTLLNGLFGSNLIGDTAVVHMKFAKWLLVASASLIYLPSWSQKPPAFPNKTVKVQVPNAPGGPVDAMARILAAHFEARFKQTFIVENRPGANGQIATEVVVRSSGDPHTLIVDSPKFLMNEGGVSTWPFRLERDVTPISIISGTGYAIIASTKAPFNTLKELVAYSRANPGKVNEAQAGTFNLDMAILRRELNMGAIEPIIYPGAAPALQALVAGDVDTSALVVQAAVPWEKSGKVKILAQTGLTRHPLSPNIPTINEADVGLRDTEMAFWLALIGPGNIPSEAVTALYSALTDLPKSPEAAGKIAGMGQVLYLMTPVDSVNRMRRELKRYQDAAAAGLRMQ